MVARDQDGREAQQTFRMNFVAGETTQWRPLDLQQLEAALARATATGGDVAGADIALQPHSVRLGATPFAEQLKAAKPQHDTAFARLLNAQTAKRGLVRPAS